MLIKLSSFPLTLLFLIITACSGGNSSENQQVDQQEGDTAQPETKKEQVVEEVTIKAIGNTMQEMNYDKEEIKVPAGAKVKLTLINEGESEAMIHNIVFVYEGTMETTANAALKAGSDKEYVPDSPTVIAGSPLAQPGETVTMEFDAPEEPGTYEFICSYPGHWQQMNGKLIVE